MRSVLEAAPIHRLRRAAGRLRNSLSVPDASSGADQWQRVVLNRDVGRYLDALSPRDHTAVEVSGTMHAGRPWKHYVSLTYPAFDLCAPLTQTERFDVVLCEQVLEHVMDPWAAAANLRRLCAPRGHVVVSTPFLIRVHELTAWGLDDYWRFTPRGLRALLGSAGLDVTCVRTWGNRSCVQGNFDRWPAYRRWHSLRNEPDLAVQVWAFARNPVAEQPAVEP